MLYIMKKISLIIPSFYNKIRLYIKGRCVEKMSREHMNKADRNNFSSQFLICLAFNNISALNLESIKLCFFSFCT